MDCSPPGSSVHGVSQARILEWVAISFSRDLPHPGLKLMSLLWQVDSLPLNHQLSPFLPMCVCVCVCVCVLAAQVCLTLCGTIDCSPPGSSVHGILQARILEWVAYSIPRGSARTQGLNPGLAHCRQILHLLSHQGSPFLTCMVYSCASLLISYMLDFCVSV